MKLLLILLSLIFISCEEGAGESATESAVELDNEKTTIVKDEETQEAIEESVALNEGSYKSNCSFENGKKYYYIITIQNYEFKLDKYEATTSNCEGMASILMARWDINGTDLNYKHTQYAYFSGGTYICDDTSMTSGDYYYIDDVNCSESYENKELNLSINDSDNYVLNGIEFFVQ